MARPVWRTWSRLDHCMKLGLKLGYPGCCINQFITLAGTKPFWYDDLPWFTQRKLKLDGYVPCEKCANKSRQTLIDEINSRRKVNKIK